MSLTKATSNVLAQDTAIKNIAEGTSGAPGFRNKIINGNFDIWQRGTTFTGINNNTFTADRWTTTSSNAIANKNVSRQTLASTDLPATEAGLVYYLRGAYTSSTGTAQFTISNPIELNQTGAISPFKIGKTYTLSYYARCASNNNISYAVQFRNASGDPTNAAIVVPNTSQAVTTSWVRYSHTFTMIAPNANNTCLCIFLTNNTVPSNTNIDITGVQLEEGSVATPFEQRPIGLELSLCQRYYYKAEAVGGDGIEVPILWRLIPHGSFHTLVYPLPVPMRSLYATVSADVVRQSTFPISFSSGPEMSYDLKSILGAVTYTGSYIDLKLITVDTEL